MQSSQRVIERVLLTNDDGINAPGLAVLEEIASSLAHDVWIVAPERDQSGTSHSISLHAPIRYSPEGSQRFSVSGTPGDCVVIAARHIMADALPTLVLSGVNRGANLGVETVFSGTVGAAMIALLLGIPSIALSQAFSNPNTIRWDTARTLAPDVIRRLLATKWSKQACLNVNFPDVAPQQARPLARTRQGAGPVNNINVIPRIDPRGFTYHWLQFHRELFKDSDDSETAVIASGGISVTPLQFERTNEAVFAGLDIDNGSSLSR